MERKHKIAVILFVAVLGLGLRLVGFDSSLWIDEFGTLWVVEGSLAQVWERTLAFQGQSPLYYTFAWLGVGLFGESEWALRLPSLLFGVATVPLVFLAGREAAGDRCGAFAALLAWLAPYLITASVDARPYSLACFFSALLVLGFLRASRTGKLGDRALFIVGGVGLFYSHYVLATLTGGLALGYVLTPKLRETYRLKWFALDASAQALLALPGFVQLARVHERTQVLQWLESPDLLVPLGVLGGLLALAASGWLLGNRDELRTPATRALVAATAAPVATLYLLALGGTYMLTPRFLVMTSVPAAVLAAQGLNVLRRSHLLLLLGLWILATFVHTAPNYLAHGSFSDQMGSERWREAVSVLDARLAEEGGAVPVLFRSGFVEEDAQAGAGLRIPATLAPLRSPGRSAPTWDVVQLTYRWSAEGRAKHFESVLAPRLRDAPVFYLLSCNNGRPGYAEELLAWASAKTGRDYVAQVIDVGPGVSLLRFASPDAR